MTTNYDVIIVGGSMVGATLAVALSQNQSLNIALIEAHKLTPITTDSPTDLRVSAVTLSNQQLLTDLSIWQHLIANRIGQFSDMIVWETSTSTLHFDSANINQPLLGYIIENKHLQQACLKRCQQLDNIQLLCPNKVVTYADKILQLDNGQSITADLIVAADGMGSSLRAWANINTQSRHYQRSAIVCTVTNEKPHQHTAWQHFLPDGPLAFLPLANPYQCSIVWSCLTKKADELIQLNEEEFARKLTHAFDSKLGTVLKVSERANFPLVSQHAHHYVKTGFALVGDAAHTIHPLAGQGVNIGLLDAIALAKIIINARQQGRQIGSLHTLKKYQRRRKGDNLMMQLITDTLAHTFGSHSAFVRWIRQYGLYSVNNSTLLKTFLMKQSSGQRLTPHNQ